MAQDGTYDRLLSRARRIGNVAAAIALLRWDQQVMMPEGGTPARAQQLSALSAVHHNLLTDSELGDLLAALSAEDLGSEQAAVVRELRRRHDRAVAVPTGLIEEMAQTTSEALPVWKRARAEDEFSRFAPIFDRLIDQQQRLAAHIGPARDPYEVLFEEYEPYLGVDTAERVLGRLREELVPLIDAISASDVSLPRPFRGSFEIEAQEALCRDALDALGYDWSRGRLDVAPHPFSTGTAFDARVTTRFDGDDLASGLLSTIHEFGHAAYALGLPDDLYATPLGDDRDMTVHESQSRLWENHVGRSRSFWELFLPAARARFPALGGVTPEEAYAGVNRVYDDNPIRVEADELTYHMHIVLRFEIERDLIRGNLDVSEVPAVWQEKMEVYLGIRPGGDAEGCLQDIHWSHGSFGYFPTYSLGSVLAAQLYARAAADIDGLEDRVRAGEFDSLREWLREHVHRHGARYTTPELVRRATGEAFTADHFIEYVTAKFSALYDL